MLTDLTAQEETVLLRKVWTVIASVVTCLTAIVIAAHSIGIPMIEENATTLVFDHPHQQSDVAKALSTAIGTPAILLDSPQIHRYLMRDSMSVDALVGTPPFALPYHLIVLKQINLGLLHFASPTELAEKIALRLKSEGYESEVISQPDPAFPSGNVVLVLSDAFKDANGSGFGIIIRKNALFVGGQKPKRFSGW